MFSTDYSLSDSISWAHTANVVVSLQSLTLISKVRKDISRVKKMDSQQKKAPAPEKVYKIYQFEVASTQIISLKDVPLKERHRDAQRPLFLTRYE